MEVVYKNENTDKRNQPEKKKGIAQAMRMQPKITNIYPYGQKKEPKRKKSGSGSENFGSEVQATMTRRWMGEIGEKTHVAIRGIQWERQKVESKRLGKDHSKCVGTNQPRPGDPSKKKKETYPSSFFIRGGQPSHHSLALCLPVLTTADSRANIYCRDCRYPMNLPA